MHNTALKLINKIEDAGFEAYIVGGYVRDYILGCKSQDVDICTSATPKELKEIFNDVVLPNEKYGSITVIFNKIRFEITTFRKDIKYKDNRIPIKIKYIKSLIEDLKRRDFTINTICINKNGEIIDLLNGQKDLEQKLIKMVGNPKTKLKEDSLRILRAIRFATILNFKIDDNLKKYITKHGHLLKKLSYHRKKEELDKIFTSKNNKYGIDLIRELKIEQYLDINLDNIVITSNSISIWAQLNVLDKYPFNNTEKETIIKLNELLNCEFIDNKIMYKYGLYIMILFAEIKNINRKEISGKYNNLPIKNQKDIDISAKEICEVLNINYGPILKTIFNDIEEKILELKIENKKEILKEYIIKNYN